MRVALALIALTGCSQIFGLSDPVRGTTGDAPGDVARDDAAGSDALGDATRFEPCDPSLTDLVACFDFEGDVENDSSAPLVVSASNYTFMAGQVGQAVRVDLTTTFTVGETTALDVSAITIEAWIKLDVLPAGAARMGVWDTNGQYGVFVRDAGVIVCTNSGPGLNSETASIAANEWTHIACTVDAAATSLYKNGVLIANGPGATLNTAGVDGTAVGGNAPTGDRLVGLIDSMRTYSSVRSVQQICDAAGC